MLVVLGVRRRDVDDVDARIGDELRVGAVRARNAALVGERPRPPGLTRCDGDDLATGRRGDVRADRRRDAAGAENAPTDHERWPSSRGTRRRRPCPAAKTGSSGETAGDDVALLALVHM